MTTNSYEGETFPAYGGRGAPTPKDQDRDDSIVNAYFDKDPTLTPDVLRSEIRRSPRVAEDIARTQRVINELRRPVPTPDLVDSILEASDRRRPFLTVPVRRRFAAAPIAIAASVLLGVGLIATLQRLTATGPVIPDPVSSAPQANGGIGTRGDQAAPPVVHANSEFELREPASIASRKRAPQKLTFGDTTAYERELAASASSFAMRSPSGAREYLNFSGGAALRLREYPELLAKDTHSLAMPELLRPTATASRWHSPLAGIRLSPWAGPTAQETFLERMLGGRSEDGERRVPNDTLPKR